MENQLNISCPILGISKQKNIIKIHHYMTDENADEVAQNMDWNAIIEGLKPHESILKVVVHGVPKDTIDLTDPQIIQSLIMANRCINSDAIIDITPLRTHSIKA